MLFRECRSVHDGYADFSSGDPAAMRCGRKIYFVKRWSMGGEECGSLSGL